MKPVCKINPVYKITTSIIKRACFDCVGIHLIGIALLSTTGCGGLDLAPVSGTLSMDGKPLDGAQVLFTPSGGQTGPSSVGTTDSEGHFKLATMDLDKRGAVPGQHRVTITTSRPEVADERSKIPKELVPTKYRDGSVHFEVPEKGTNAADFEIVTK